mgnify:CR=1 FL=1
MKKVKKALIMFRDVLHMINGNLITCNYDVSTKSVEHKGIDWHCVIWFKQDGSGDLVEGKTSYLSWSEVESRWAFHEGFNSDLLALKKSMRKGKKASKKSKK